MTPRPQAAPDPTPYELVSIGPLGVERVLGAYPTLEQALDARRLAERMRLREFLGIRRPDAEGWVDDR